MPDKHISTELMNAIISMDTYNRDYNAGFVVNANRIGNYTFEKDSSKLIKQSGDRADIPAGFYAASYTSSSGEAVIAYRGEDKGIQRLSA